MARQPRPKVIATATRNSPANSEPEIQEQIRLRAYQLYEQRARTQGHELDEWLQAETELLAKAELLAKSRALA